MTVSAERALLAAVRAGAAANAGVIAAFGAPARLYDEHPTDPIFPYVTFGQQQSRPLEVALSGAVEHTLSLHVWSRHAGKAEALSGLDALRGALHDRALSLTGHALIYLYAVFLDVFRGPDGRTFHGVLRLRAVTEPV